MMTEAEKREEGRETRRILLLLDASRPSLDAIGAAVERALQRKLELHALFVEEEDLLRSAGYAFAREIGATSGASRPLRDSAVEARLRRQASRIGRALEQALAGRELVHTLSVRRGRLLSEVLSLAGPEDLLVLGKVGWSATPGRVLGSSALALARQAPGSVLLWTSAGAGRRRDVVVVVDDFESSRLALAAAAELAGQREADLDVVLIPPEDPRTVAERDRAVRDWLSASGVAARLRKTEFYDPPALARMLRSGGVGELVISRRSRLMRDTDAEAFLQAVTVPVSISP
ncbi:MAG: universal stress protein [Wenzhouxiangella sp.]